MIVPPGLRGMIPMRRDNLRDAVTRHPEGRPAIMIQDVLKMRMRLNGAVAG
jgi:hypothetical protein